MIANKHYLHGIVEIKGEVKLLPIYGKERIASSRIIELEVFYEPDAAETAALKPDLSKESP